MSAHEARFHLTESDRDPLSFTYAKSLNLINRVVDALPWKDVRVRTDYTGLLLNTSEITQYRLYAP